jgi:hypothetical protein
LEELYRLNNGRLRLRWSQRQEKWAVEGQVLRPIEYIRTLPPFLRIRIAKNVFRVVENDEWVRARDGYLLIGHYAPQPVLGDWVIKNLRYYDLRRFSGGWKEAELEVIRFEERREERKEAHHRQRLRDISDDMYEDAQWRQGERAAVPRPYGEVA